MTTTKKIHFEIKHEDKKSNSAAPETKTDELPEGNDEAETGKFDPKQLSLPELIYELASYGIKHRPSKKLN